MRLPYKRTRRQKVLLKKSDAYVRQDNGAELTLHPDHERFQASINVLWTSKPYSRQGPLYAPTHFPEPQADSNERVTASGLEISFRCWRIASTVARWGTKRHG